MKYMVLHIRESEYQIFHNIIRKCDKHIAMETLKRDILNKGHILKTHASGSI